MKLTVLLFLLLFLRNFGIAQTSCLPEGIVFTHQYQIDAFQNQYPGCTDIEGSVIIFGDDVQNVLGLSIIKSIGGYLQIGHPLYSKSLTNLYGLEGLISVGGGISIIHNANLNDIKGLGNVTDLGTGGLTINFNNSLRTLAGLEKIFNAGGVQIEDNPYLHSIEGLSSLSAINGNGFVCISNDSLLNFSGLENLKKCVGNLEIGNNKSLNSFDALRNLNEFSGGVIIYNNNALSSLKGLDSIPGVKITTLTIINNELLNNCHVQSVCDRLAFGLGGINHIQNNATGCADNIQVINNCESLGIGGHHYSDEIEIDCDFSNQNLLIRSNLGNKIVDIAILDISGREMINHSFSIYSSINLSNLNSGLYFLRVSYDKKTIIRKLLRE